MKLKGASVKKLFWVFFWQWSYLSFPKILTLTDPPFTFFLPYLQDFLTNIRCRYFSLNIWVVYDQLELDWCIFDQNWAKTRPLQFQLFQILNATDRRIVQWPTNLLISNLFSNYIKTFWPAIILFLSSLLTALFSHYNAKNARMTCNHETKRATWSGFLSHLKYPTGADMICRYSQRGNDIWFWNWIAGDFCFNLFVSGFDRLFFRIGHFCCHCCQRNSAPPFPICHLEWASISTNWFFALSLLKHYM